MYFPYMRGKQFELIALRNLASKIQSNKVKPIIEPVKSNLSPLKTTLQELNKNDIEPLVLINPIVGELNTYKTPAESIELIQNLQGEEKLHFLPCIVITPDNQHISIALANQLYQDKTSYSLYLKGVNHHGIEPLLKESSYNIFPQNSLSSDSNLPERTVIISDPFPHVLRNADFSEHSYRLSNSHLTFQKREGQVGFADYLTVGERWITGGGPAYVVALHLTYINKHDANMMYIKHALSDVTSKSQANPGQKFKDALKILIKFADDNSDTIELTDGLLGFKALHERQHFPGLGEAKKLSMMHHIETLARFI